ncbi:hypothetical protein ACLMJK_004554 [Lecanora helva]
MDFDSDFAVIEKAGYCIALCSREEPYVLNDKAGIFTSKSSSFLVYAETIDLSSSIKLPGKTLGLFCQNLTLSGFPNVIIDVSGVNGSAKPAVAVGDGAKGDDGQDGGSVFISVESSIADLTKLQVKAFGGDGGQGGASSDSKKTAKGGDGGKGGNAGRLSIIESSVRKLNPMTGKITLLFNNKTHEINSSFQQSITQAYTATWHEKCLIAKSILSDQQINPTNSSAIEFLVFFGKSLKSSMISAEDQAQLSQRLLQDLRGDLRQYAKLDIYIALSRALEAQKGTTNLKVQLEASLSASTKKVLEATLLDLSNQEDALQETLTARLSVSPGKFHYVSRASFADIAKVVVEEVGVDGVPLAKNNRRCSYLPGPGDDFEVDLDLPVFFPDQVRMLLKRADAQFLRNTSESLVIASQLYERLVRRLGFVPLLNSNVNSSSPIAQIFRNLFEKNSICISPFSELKGVLEEATARLARMKLGQDMFGQDSTWVPRLSYFYYEKRIDDMIGNYKTLAAQLDKYKTKADKADDKREAVASVRDAAKKDGAGVQARLDALLDENGPLLTTAYKIRTFDPVMKDQQRHLKAQMESIASRIKSSINVSKVIDAFTSIASSSSKAEAGKNVLKAGYSLYESLTVVQDADSQSIDKAIIVKQVTTCGDTIESLQQAISANSDGSVALEDAGAVKVITTKENISKMLNQFRNILPDTMTDTTNKQLDAFLQTVISRNNAVLEYNSLAQLLAELQSIKKQQAAMIDALSQQQLQKVDPGLPSIVNWLRRTRDDLATATMQQLNYASRAIRYWGLFDGLPLDEPGPLLGVTELEQIQRRLKQNFDACLTDFAGSAWNWWPSGDSPGNFYRLTTEQLTQLKTAQRPRQEPKAIYTTNIPLSPDSPGMAGIGSNVRIRQVRLWLTNAYVDAAVDTSGRRILTISLTHTGNETIQKTDTKTFTFTHSPVKINFRYHCGGVQALADAKAAAVFGQQVIENDYQNPTVSSANAAAIAPLGPFTMWTVTIREKDNPVLDLSRVDGAWLEFWGRSKPL